MDHKTVIALAKALREHEDARPGSACSISLALGLVDNTYTRAEWGALAREMLRRGLGADDIARLVSAGESMAAKRVAAQAKRGGCALGARRGAS